ncbi:hypothetical protein IQ273_14685 [Nodosilinea sp. LEGE 07298]|uniref:hypothetical protein n=1 Tax=Nodosilinea sp. LEGE 07298 TaxID=2777970 RepID=UPI00188107E6|nr:hypothetical protein [Nodosilinea sp. LEGE 07298]MBE9110665.1 hypothetical protein [Nodosilinea sp. LEGE 07298]
MPVGEAKKDQADQVKKPKVDRLREQRDKLNSQIRQVEAHELNRKRRDDTRRKVLIGAAIMARVNNQKDDWSEDRLLAMMDNFLTRPKERDLFGLEPLPKPQGEAAPTAKNPVNATSKRETKKVQDDKGKQVLAAPAATGVSSDAGLGVQDTDHAPGGGQNIHHQARKTTEDAIAATSITEAAKTATGNQVVTADSAGTEPAPPATSTGTATSVPTSTAPTTTDRQPPKRRLPESADEDDLEKEFNL